MKFKLLVTWGMVVNLGAIAALALCAGCATGNQAVPSSRIKWDQAKGTVDLTLPKNESISALKVTRDTNGNVTVSLEGLNSLNDPNVVNAGYSGQQIQQAQAFNFGLLLGQMGANGALKAFGLPGSVSTPLLNVGTNAGGH